MVNDNSLFCLTSSLLVLAMILVFISVILFSQIWKFWFLNDLSLCLGESVTSGLSWAAVASVVATRSEKQCRTKWLNSLNWRETGGTEWTREHDQALVLK